jgi:hypothetical protein
MGSFYDLDYVIKLNEERLEQYSNFYQKNIDKFTTILVLYSAFAIFLIPIVQSLFFEAAKCHWFYHVCFYVFIALLGVSVVNTVRLLMPVKVAYLLQPELYYKEYKNNYTDENIEESEVDRLLKLSYISEVERAINSNKNIFIKKALFYDKAFLYAIAACIPYLICIVFELSIKDDKLQQTEIFNHFNKTEYMVKKTESMKISDIPRGSDFTFPGIDSSKVIPSYPVFIHDNVSFRMLWDNEVTQFIKDFVVRLLRSNKSHHKE